MTKPLVVITGLQAAENPSPGVAVARSLKAIGVKTLGIVYSGLETGAHMPGLFDKVLRFSKPEENLDLFFEQFDKVMDEYHPSLIIPTLDPEIPLFADRYYNSHIQCRYPVLVPRPSSLGSIHKLNLPEFASKFGLRFPRQEIAYCVEDVEKAVKRFGLPVMLKGQWYEAYEIEHLDETPHYFRELTKRWKLPLIVQQKISGSEITIACLCDRGSRLINYGMIRKWGKSSQGKTWCAVTFSNPDYINIVQNMLFELQWVGPCEIEFFVNEHSGMLTMFEFNMRLPSWIYLGAETGVNFPENILKIVESKPLDKKCIEPGKAFARVAIDYAVPIERILALETLGKING